MNKADIHSQGQMLDACFGALSTARVLLQRNADDQFEVDIQPQGDYEKPHARHLTREGLLKSGLFPAGSRWQAALNLLSYVGLPFSIEGQQYLALGFETVVPHPKRHSYPYVHLHIFRYGNDRLVTKPSLVGDILQAMQQWADYLFPQPCHINEDLLKLNGLYQCRALYPEQERMAGFILHDAVKRYEPVAANLQRQPWHYRTLVLSENQLQNREGQWLAPTFLQRALQGRAAQGIVVVSPPVSSFFSPQTQAWLRQTYQDEWETLVQRIRSRL